MRKLGLFVLLYLTYIHEIAEVKHEEVVLDCFVGEISGKRYLDSVHEVISLLRYLSIMSMVLRIR